MVASDLRLGGFNGEWGDAAPAVKTKKAKLEGEGVIFDSKTGKIAKSCVFTWPLSGKEEKLGTTAHKRALDVSGSSNVRSKQRKQQRPMASFFGGSGGSGDDPERGHEMEKGGKSKSVRQESAAIVPTGGSMHAKLRASILAILSKRAPGKTC